MIEVRCCCEPENLIGLLPEGMDLPLRELDDGTFAYEAHGMTETQILAAGGRKGKKGRRKTWKEK